MIIVLKRFELCTVSRTSKRSLGAVARGRTMVTTEKGRDRRRYPEIMDMAITKNLKNNT